MPALRIVTTAPVIQSPLLKPVPAAKVFRDILLNMLTNCPVSLTDKGEFVLDEDASAEDAIRVFRLIDRAQTNSSVAVRFAIGDLWRTLSKKHGDKFRFIQEIFPDDRKLQQMKYKEYMNYAWVSGKWPAGMRREDKVWQYFKDERPGGRDHSLPKAPQVPLAIRINSGDLGVRDVQGLNSKTGIVHRGISETGEVLWEYVVLGKIALDR